MTANNGVTDRDNFSLERCIEIVGNDLKKISNALATVDEETKNIRSVNPWTQMVVGVVSSFANHKRLANYLTIFGEAFDNLELDYYVILADPNIEPEDGKDFVLYEDTRIFLAKAKDSYETLAHKLAIFYSYICQHTDYDYVIKCDDGCLLDLNNTIVNLEADYIGTVLTPTLNTVHFGKCTDQAYNTQKLDFGHSLKHIKPDMDDKLYDSLYHIRYAGGGYGYRFNRKALQCIDRYKPHILSLGLSYEDILFAQICFLEGIHVTSQDIGRYHAITGDA